MIWKSTPGLRTTVLTCKFSPLHCLQDPEVYNHQIPSLGYHKCKHSQHPVTQQTTECDREKLVTLFNKAAYSKLFAVLGLAKIPYTKWVTASRPHHQWEKHNELSFACLSKRLCPFKAQNTNSRYILWPWAYKISSVPYLYFVLHLCLLHSKGNLLMLKN